MGIILFDLHLGSVMLAGVWRVDWRRESQEHGDQLKVAVPRQAMMPAKAKVVTVGTQNGFFWKAIMTWRLAVCGPFSWLLFQE